MTVKVVTTIAPDEEPTEVSIAEAIDLARQGLVVPGEGDIDRDGAFDVAAHRQAELDAEIEEAGKRRAAARREARKAEKKEG